MEHLMTDSLITRCNQTGVTWNYFSQKARHLISATKLVLLEITFRKRAVTIDGLKESLWGALWRVFVRLQSYSIPNFAHLVARFHMYEAQNLSWNCFEKANVSVFWPSITWRFRTDSVDIRMPKPVPRRSAKRVCWKKSILPRCDIN